MLAAPSYVAQSMIDEIQFFIDKSSSHVERLAVLPQTVANVSCLGADEISAETAGLVDCRPSIMPAADNLRVIRFQRVLKTCLKRHTLTVAITTGILLSVAVSLGATNIAVFSGLTCYLLGSACSALIFFQGMQNAAYADEKL